MITFVQQTESQMSQLGKDANLNLDSALVESIVRSFATNWKQGIEQINKNVLSYFSNFRNGLEILKQCLTQMLLYYTRLQAIITKGWGRRPPSFVKDLVSTGAILSEIKRYALAI